MLLKEVLLEWAPSLWSLDITDTSEQGPLLAFGFSIDQYAIEQLQYVCLFTLHVNAHLLKN